MGPLIFLSFEIFNYIHFFGGGGHAGAKERFTLGAVNINVMPSYV